MSAVAVAVIGILAAAFGAGVAWVVQKLRFAGVVAVAQGAQVTAEALKEERSLRAESEQSRNNQLEFSWKKDFEDAKLATDAEAALARWRAARRVLAGKDGDKGSTGKSGAVPPPTPAKPSGA